MKNKIICALSLLMIIASCNRAPSHDEGGESITAGEDSGIKSILEFYGGECAYFTGFTTSGNASSRYFKIQLSKSKVARQYAGKAALITSNIALLFCKNLSENERNVYASIRVVVILDDEKKIEHEYLTDDVQLAIENLPIIADAVDRIKRKDTEQLKAMINPDSLFDFNKDELVARITQSTNEEIRSFKVVGFRYFTVKGKTVLGVYAILFRSQSNSEFSAIFDPLKQNGEVLLIDFAWS